MSYVYAVLHYDLKFCWLTGSNIQIPMCALAGERQVGKKEGTVVLGRLPDKGWGHCGWETERLSGNSTQLCTSRIRKTLPETRL